MNSHHSTPPELKGILATLGEEVRRPIEALQGEIDRLLQDPDQPISDTQRAHTQTMQAVCEEMRKLTEACLGQPLQDERAASTHP